MSAHEEGAQSVDRASALADAREAFARPICAALERARSNLDRSEFARLAAAVNILKQYLQGMPGIAELPVIPRGPFATLHPPPPLDTLHIQHAWLEGAKGWLDEAYKLARPGLLLVRSVVGTLLCLDELKEQVTAEMARHAAAIERRRLAETLDKLGSDATAWLKGLPSLAVSMRLHAARDLLLGDAPVIRQANDSCVIETSLSGIELRFLDTLERALLPLLADVDQGDYFESLLRRNVERTDLDPETVRQVREGLAWAHSVAKLATAAGAPVPGTAPTQPAPAEVAAAGAASPDPNAQAFASLCEARDYAYEALQLNLDPEVFRPDLAGGIEHARSEIATALRMIAPEGATDLDTPRAVVPFDAPTPSWALTRAYAALFQAAPADNTPARKAVHRATMAVLNASIEAGRAEEVTREVPTRCEGLTHNQRVTLERGLRTLTEAHDYACAARSFGEDEQSPDGSALEQVCAEVWDARDLVRRVLEPEREHLADGWDNERVLHRETTSATRALVVLHETLTEWLDDADPRRRSLPRDVPDDVLQAVRGALLSVDRVIVARTAYAPATTARRFLGGVLMRLARAVRP